MIERKLLLAGEDESAARGLLAAFAWAAPDIVRSKSVTEMLEIVADVLHWQGHSVFVFAIESMDPVAIGRVLARTSAARLGGPLRMAGPGAERLLRAADERPRSEETWDGELGPPWVCFKLRVAGGPTWLLVVEGRVFTTAALEAIAAFVRLTESTVTRIAEHEKLVAALAEQETRARIVIASERLSVLGEAAAVLAHEMRNPLGTISNALALLGRTDLADRGVALSIIGDEVRRLDALVQDLLQLARPVDPARRRVELGRLVANAIERSRKELNGTHVLVPPSAVPDDLVVAGDPALLALALENLIRNAAQASPPRSEIRVDIASLAAEVTLSVEDDGPGVAKAIQERIFEPFFTTRPVGTGLGLSIVKRLVEAHGGSVRVGSSRSGGARFDLVFARAR